RGRPPEGDFGGFFDGELGGGSGGRPRLSPITTLPTFSFGTTTGKRYHQITMSVQSPGTAPTITIHHVTVILVWYQDGITLPPTHHVGAVPATIAPKPVGRWPWFRAHSVP